MGLRLFFLPNFPSATFIQGATFIPDSRVVTNKKLLVAGHSDCGHLSLLPPAPRSRIHYKFLTLKYNEYHKVMSSNTSRLEAHAGFLRLLMKEFESLCTVTF